MDLDADTLALFRGYRAKEPKEILEAMTHTEPLAQLMDGQIAALRHWAKGRARASTSRSTLGQRNSRRMSEAN